MYSGLTVTLDSSEPSGAVGGPDVRPSRQIQSIVRKGQHFKQQPEGSVQRKMQKQLPNRHHFSGWMDLLARLVANRVNHDIELVLLEYNNCKTLIRIILEGMHRYSGYYKDSGHTKYKSD